MCAQHALLPPSPAAPQLTDRQRGVQFLLDLAITYAFPAHKSEFALQIIDLTQAWSNGASGTIECDDLLALAAAVYVYIKLHFTPQQTYPRSLLELHAAFAALFVRRQPDDVPELHTPSSWSYTRNSGYYSWTMK